MSTNIDKLVAPIECLDYKDLKMANTVGDFGND